MHTFAWTCTHSFPVSLSTPCLSLSLSNTYTHAHSHTPQGEDTDTSAYMYGVKCVDVLGLGTRGGMYIESVGSMRMSDACGEPCA